MASSLDAPFDDGIGNVTFIHEPYQFADLKDTTVNGFRKYRTPSGEAYASVTSVLSATADKRHLQEWRDRIGHEEADKITRQAANRGTQMHKIFEDFLNNSLDTSAYNPIQYTKFLEAKAYLAEHISKIHNIEFALYSDRLKIAGRCDLLCEWDGELAIVDHKTSNRSKREDWITDYFIQKTLYACMVYELLGLKVKKIVTFIVVDDETVPQIFVKQPGDYLKQALERVRKYHAIQL